MRNLDPAFASHLAGEVATLCHCWRLTRRDGLVLGFTDHDRDLTFGATTFRARAGLEAAEVTSELGLAVGGGEVSGALSSTEITQDDIAAGLYDDATVEAWLVNWSDVSQRHLLDVASIGEIKRGEDTFIAELRGIAHRFDQDQGRLFRSACSADLGDSRCGISVNQPAYQVTAGAIAIRGRLGCLTAALPSYDEGWFTGGKLTWLTGLNAGLSGEIKLHARVTGGDEILLWQPATHDIVISDTFRLSAGCDKTFLTCRAKFSNAVRFRGFPHLPGNDFVVRLPKQGESGLDGGSMFR
jgi:uncharacterized phage protein (TIGR02218 family)